LQYNRPQNADLVREALQKAGREDHIGYSEDCLVRPAGAKGNYSGNNTQERNGRQRTDGKNARGGSSSGKKPSAAQKSAQNPKNSVKSNPKPEQKSQKPTYKAGWAKPKAKKNNKKK
jgi:hypothetical protein